LFLSVFKAQILPGRSFPVVPARLYGEFYRHIPAGWAVLATIQVLLTIRLSIVLLFRVLEKRMNK
jgi:ABC-type uncharacterized transport system permease subunit